jgi:hypothetical protein
MTSNSLVLYRKKKPLWISVIEGMLACLTDSHVVSSRYLPYCKLAIQVFSLIANSYFDTRGSWWRR